MKMIRILGGLANKAREKRQTSYFILRKSTVEL